jgi:catechol 2,3-dioxygenase-like lactoylglutathione lyase family enzyme
MVKVIKLAHVGLNALDLGRQAEFYNDKWGLERIDEFAGELFFRAEGPAHHVLTLHENADIAGLHHVALEVASVAEIDQAYEELEAAGVDVVTPPAQELEPGVMKAIRFKDPDGFLVELVAGVDSVRDPYALRDVKPQALNHVVLNVGDADRSEAFYRDLLGFKLTDRVVGGLSFWGCNANHHSLAFGQARDGQPTFNHAAFEMRDWEAWMRAVFFAGERGIKRVWGPGRHVFGNNLFSYYKDPEGNTVEYTAEVEQITDPNRKPRVETPRADQWVSENRP